GRQALTAVFFRMRQPLPATGGVFRIGFFIATGGFDLPLFQAAAFFIGFVIQRRDDVFAKLGALGQNGVHDIGCCVGPGAKGFVMGLVVEHLIEKELHVA